MSYKARFYSSWAARISCFRGKGGLGKSNRICLAKVEKSCYNPPALIFDSKVASGSPLQISGENHEFNSYRFR